VRAGAAMTSSRSRDASASGATLDGVLAAAASSGLVSEEVEMDEEVEAEAGACSVEEQLQRRLRRLIHQSSPVIADSHHLNVDAVFISIIIILFAQYAEMPSVLVAFSALTLLVGRRKGIRPVKN